MTASTPNPMIDTAVPTNSDGVFDLLSFLEGAVRAWGVFEDRSGRVRRRFVADLIGRRDGSCFVIDEEFRFDDGVIEQRQWQFERGEGGAFQATATDVIGHAEGRAEAGGARMRYQFRLTLKGRSVVVDFDDRFYPIDGERIINRATVSKFGVRLGELTILFERHPADVAGSTGAVTDPAARQAA